MFCGVFFFTALLSTTTVQAASTTVQAIEETSTYSKKATTVDATKHRVWVGISNDSGVEKAYIKFPRTTDLSKVTSAKLKLYVFDEDAFHDVTANPTLKFGHTISIRPMRGNWSENSLTESTASSLIWESGYGTATHTLAAGTPRMNWVTLDVTDLVKKQATVTQDFITFELSDPQASSANVHDIAFTTKEYTSASSSVGPQLELTTADTNNVSQPATTGNVIIRTTFLATPAQEPTPQYGTATSPWPRVAVYLNNGYSYDGLKDYGSCTNPQAIPTSPKFAEPFCGKPNLYREKLLEEFEVSAATFTKDITVPAANLTFQPYSSDTVNRYTKISYAYHNDYWNPGLNLDRGVGITKVEFIEVGTNKVLKTLIPADNAKYLNGSTATGTFAYQDLGVSSFAGVKDSTQDGMVNAFDTLERSTPFLKDNSWYIAKDGTFNIVTSELNTALQCGGTNVGDLDNDKDVDIFDYNKMVQDFGRTGAKCFSPADIDGDGDVDIFDYNKLVGAFGKKYS